MSDSNSLIIGIDLGTSSAKILCAGRDGKFVKVRKEYPQNGPAGQTCWFDSIVECFEQLRQRVDLTKVQALSLACQVNTYILYNSSAPTDELVVSNWADDQGAEQLEQLTERFDDDYFLGHISMRHPKMISYPLPRLRYLQNTMTDKWNQADMILQPKDYLYHKLTGIFASDPFTWRGLSNIDDCTFHDTLLADSDIPADKLPRLYQPFAAPGRLLENIAKKLGLNKNIPVYLGCNDFFAGLLGMGIVRPNQYFDVTGTSEHIGMISNEIDTKTDSISGPYFKGFVRYGVTSSSGTSLKWAKQMLTNNTNCEQIQTPPGPIFLPYLNGERSPIWDSKARGVFFGLDSSHDASAMVSSVKEGIVFSLLHILKTIELDRSCQNQGITLGGAAAQDQTLNQLKADIFQTNVKIVKEKESTALGAAMIASVANGWFENISQAAEAFVKIDHQFDPNPEKLNIIKKRFDIYQSLYPALKSVFHSYSDMKEKFSE